MYSYVTTLCSVVVCTNHKKTLAHNQNNFLLLENMWLPILHNFKL